MKPYKYSQWIAFRALCIASLKSLVRTPSYLLFNLLFPIALLIGVHYFTQSSYDVSRVRVAVVHLAHNAHNDTMFRLLSQSAALQVEEITVRDSLQKSKIFEKGAHAIITLSDTLAPQVLYFDERENKMNAIVRSALQSALSYVCTHLPNLQESFYTPRSAGTASTLQIIVIIAFVVFSSGVFGVAFTFFTLKSGQVFKLIFSTPMRISTIIAAELSSRFIFILSNALIVLILGILFFDFTCVGGALAWFRMLVVLGIGLLSFMTYGFVISCIARSVATIPAIGNIIVVPQWALGEMFFSNSIFPHWIGRVADFLPFTNFIRALKSIVLQGATLGDCVFNIVILILWGVLGLMVSYRLFNPR